LYNISAVFNDEQFILFLNSKPAINGLRVRGLIYIKDLLPFSKLAMFLKGVQTPQSLIDISKDMVNALLKMGAVSKGLGHTPSIKRLSQINLSARSSAELNLDDVAEAIEAAEAADAAVRAVDMQSTENSAALTYVFPHTLQEFHALFSICFF
jgi:hypothetical protein